MDMAVFGVSPVGGRPADFRYAAAICGAASASLRIRFASSRVVGKQSKSSSAPVSRARTLDLSELIAIHLLLERRCSPKADDADRLAAAFGPNYERQLSTKWAN
jgi:hypothetical protein